MTGRLAGKVAFISGGAEGLGEATARLFAAEGARVAIGDVQLDKARVVARSIGEAALAVPLDVTVRASWNDAVEAAVQAFGKLNVLVNNAGISEPGDIESVSEAAWRRTMSVNLDGVFYGCQQALPSMIAAKESGAIVNISSMLALRPGSMFLAYCASKAGVAMLTKCIALHCAKQGYPIRANSVHPGAIETPMLERYLAIVPELSREEAYAGFAANHPMGRCGRPAEVAEACLYLASDASSFTTGTELTVDGGGFIRE
jgi:3alpha(or 20beta)-hydroxysteroid dehydrogenase